MCLPVIAQMILSFRINCIQRSFSWATKRRGRFPVVSRLVDMKNRQMSLQISKRVSEMCRRHQQWCNTREKDNWKRICKECKTNLDDFRFLTSSNHEIYYVLKYVKNQNAMDNIVALTLSSYTKTWKKKRNASMKELKRSLCTGAQHPWPMQYYRITPDVLAVGLSFCVSFGRRHT